MIIVFPLQKCLQEGVASLHCTFSLYAFSELLKQKVNENQYVQQKFKKSKKKNIDRNWTITNCLLSDSNPNYQCLKITSCRWRPPPRMHSFTATKRFKSSRSFVSPCATLSHSAEHATHTGWHKRTGTFETRSGSERMRTWRRTPYTGHTFKHW